MKQPDRQPKVGTTQVPQTRRLAASIARRWRLGLVFSLLSRGLAAAGASGLLLVLTARGLGPATWAIWAVLGLALVAGIAALAWALSHRRSLEAAASAADGHAGLKDALLSALLLSRGRRHEDAGFAALAIARAEAAAGNIMPTEVAPVRLGRAWVAWPTLVALACAAAVFLPPWGNQSITRETSVAATDPKQVERAQQGIEDLALALEQHTAGAEDQEDDAQDGRLERQLERLRELEGELASGQRDPQAAMTEAVAAATEAAEAMEEDAREQELADEALRDALANMEQTSDREQLADDSLRGAAERLAQAMERGDLESAADAAEELMQRSQDPQASEQERRQTADRLRELADRLDPQSLNNPEQSPQPQPAPPTDEPAGTPQPQSEQPPTPPPPTPPPTQPTETPDETGDQGDPSEPENQDPTASDPPASEPQASPEEQLREQDAQRREQAHRDAQEKQRELGESMRDAANELERGEEQPQQEQEQQDPGQEPQQQQGDQPGQKQGQQPGQQPSDQQGDQQDEQNGDQQPGKQGFAERLRDLADRQRDAQQQHEQAEDLRQRAREAFDRMSPQEQRELLERLREQAPDQPQGEDAAGAFPSPEEAGEQPPDGIGGGPGEAEGNQPGSIDPWQRELMDLPGRESGANPRDSTVAEWFGDGIDTAGAASSAVADDVREAARGAQEAIERERIPRRRRELIRRVFERYAEQFGREKPAQGGDGS